VQRKLRFFLGPSLVFIVPTLVVPLFPLAAQSANVAVAPHGSMDTLAQYVIESHPEIEAQRQQVRITKARLQAAEAGFLPTIEANGIVQKREIDVKKGGTGDASFIAGQASVEARVRFYDGDRTYNAVQVAKAELASAEAVLDATISDILLELLTSAADVHLDRKVRQFSQLQSDAISEQLRATGRKLEFGESTRTDENLAKARLAAAESGILAATQELNVNGYRFRSVSGQSATVVPSLSPLAAMPASLIDAQGIAIKSSPRLRAARLNADAGKKGVNLAAGALLPQVDAVGGYEYLTGGVANLFTGKLPNDRSALYSGIEVRVPIFQPRDYAELRRARAIRDQRLSQTEIGVRAVTEEVASSWTRWQSAKSIIATAEQAVAAIEKAAEGIKKESVEGNRTLTDVLDAQNELLAARITLERAVRNEFVARAGLLASTSGLTASSVLSGGAGGATATMPRPAISALGPKPEPAKVAATTNANAFPGRPDSAGLGIITTTAANGPFAEAEPQANPSRPPVATLGRARY
jgi:outer membrane protein